MANSLLVMTLPARTQTFEGLLKSGAYVVLDSSVLFVVPGCNGQQLSGEEILGFKTRGYRALNQRVLQGFVDRLDFENSLLRHGRVIVPFGVYNECGRAHVKLIYRRRDYEVTPSNCPQRSMFLKACRLADENMLLMAKRVPFVRQKPDFVALRNLCRAYAEHLNIKGGVDLEGDERVDEDTIATGIWWGLRNRRPVVFAECDGHHQDILKAHHSLFLCNELEAFAPATFSSVFFCLEDMPWRKYRFSDCYHGELKFHSGESHPLDCFDDIRRRYLYADPQHLRVITQEFYATPKPSLMHE